MTIRCMLPFLMDRMNSRLSRHSMNAVGALLNGTTLMTGSFFWILHG